MKIASRNISTSRRRSPAPRRVWASFRSMRVTKFCDIVRSPNTISPSSKLRRNGSAIRCCRSCSNSLPCAGTVSASGVTGARPPRTSPTRPRSCKSAKRSISSGPITFGYKVATYLAGFERHLQRLKELRPRVLVGEFGGAAGTLSSLGSCGLEVQAALMQELGLGQPDIAWHTVRDCIAEVGCFLGLVTGSCGKIAFDVKLMMQTEVEEVYEPFHEGRGSSSTMPQKRNPISSVYITATTSLVRQHVAALLDAMVEDHERATGAWEIEWIAVPEIFSLA